MVVREAGILFRGFTIVHSSYHDTSHEEIDKDLRSALLTALISFAESTFERNKIEYFEGKKFVVSFTQDKIISDKDRGPEDLMAYAILDREEKNMDKVIHKIIQPPLKKVLREFKERYEGVNLIEISKLKPFKKNLDDSFGLDVLTLDQKVKSVFF